MNVSKKTMSRALKENLGLKAKKGSNQHLRTQRQIKNRRIRSRALLKRYAGEKWKRILFTDEKIFTVEAKFNKQNDRVYATSVKAIPKKIQKVNRAHHPASVMVWMGVSWMGKTKLHFVPQGVKVRAQNYMQDILKPIVEPLNQSLFQNGHWTFQQDSAPAHQAKMVQKWLKAEIPDFISSQEWPAASPDLNPLDYDIWSKLELDACTKPHTSLESLKKSLVKMWDDYPLTRARTAIEDWIPRLKACVAAKGGHFEK